MTNIRGLRGLSTTLAPGGAAALTCIVYAGSLANGFVFDDSAYLGSPEVRDFDLRGAPGTRQLDHDDQVSMPVGAEEQLPGLAKGRLLREVRRSNRPPAERRLRGRE